jgi:dGTPase
VREGIVRHSSRAPVPATLEGRIVRLVDRVAYINHDIDDALRAGVLDPRDLPADAIGVLGDTGSARIDALVRDLVEHSAAAGDIVQGDEAGPAMDRLRTFMFDHVYLGPVARREHAKVHNVVRSLFAHYAARPDEIPDGGGAAGADVPQRVTDWLAGMTDRFCLRAYTDFTVPERFVT